MLEVGSIAPDFSVPNQDDIEISFRDIKGKWIVLYFYPRDLTPGCIIQACDFTAQEELFDDLDAFILGVSADTPSKHRSFIEKKDLSITLLSDEDKSMCEAYGVWQLKKFMGKENMGIVRTTFIINPEGKIAAVWNKVSVRKKDRKTKEETLHVDDVRETLKQLQNN
ncbi:MAG: thioredoxin-dependent thiol peroxidase [Campylobacteraceae bacterium]|nr:thioredoxin-dependent thiol peroxidase [Campylobacteraceae bacterium]